MAAYRLLHIARTVGILLALSAAARAQFTAAPGSPFPAGTNPVSVAVGDFNGDGYPDLALANLNGTGVTVLLGNGKGGFTAAPGSPFAAGNDPSFVAVGDFNGDGFPDLAVTNLNGKSVTVLLGNGTGGFTTAPGSPFAVGSNPNFVAVADVNGDKYLDLVVSNAGDNTVTVLLGNGTGGFTAAPGGPFAVGGNPSFIAVGDFNGDRLPDLAIANLVSNNVTVLLGNGKGGFIAAPGSPFADTAAPQGASAVQASPVSLAIGDFNGDGNPDLVIANEAANNITVLLGNGKGGFTAASTSPIQVGSEPVSVAIGDFNSDGNLDLAVVNYSDGTVTVLLGNGQAGFATASGIPYKVGALPHSVAIGDFNGDGKPDLAVANEGGNTVTVLLNNFSGPVTVSAASGSAPVAPGSIVSIYGNRLASTGTSATTLPLPINLGGTSVNITFSNGTQASLPLFYAGPGQINALIPQSAVSGTAALTVFTASGSQSGPVIVTPTAPALFTANETIQGVAVGQLISPLPNGFQSISNVFTCPGGPATCITVPLDVSSGNSFLVLYGTGIQNAAPGSVSVTIGGGAPIQASFFGATGYPGEDQVNVALPASLAGSGLVHVTVSVAGTTSNIVTVYIQ